MSRAAIKYQSYFISFQSCGRSTFGRLIFFLPPTSRPLSLSLASFSLALSRLSRFVLLSFSRVSFLTIYIWFCGSMVRARTAIKYQSYRLISRTGRPAAPVRSASGCCAPRGAQVCSASRI